MSLTSRILIVEDDDALRFNLVSYLEDSGFEIADTGDGVQGLRLVRERAPDLVLCDLRMPGLDGLEMIRALGREYAALPVVAISGTGVLSDAVEALRAGAVDFVAKPIADMEVLEHVVRRALERARLERENRAYQRRLEEVNRELRDHLDRLERDAAAGRQTQLQMMPPQRRVYGRYTFARHLQPSVNLSGDFVDYFEIDARHLGFYLADVSGHGVASGFVTVLLRTMVRRYLEQHHQSADATVLAPARTLARLNEELHRLHLDKYLTIFYGVIDTVRNRLSYSCGGHYPHPILFDTEQSRFVEGKGFPVGLLPEADYDGGTVELPPRFVLAVFSDGVLETMEGLPAPAKRQRLLDCVAGNGDEMTRLITALGLQAERSYPDDVTLLTVRRSSE